MPADAQFTETLEVKLAPEQKKWLGQVAVREGLSMAGVLRRSFDKMYPAEEPWLQNMIEEGEEDNE